MSWDSKHLRVAPVGDPKHLYVAPVGNPNAWAYSNACVWPWLGIQTPGDKSHKAETAALGERSEAGESGQEPQDLRSMASGESLHCLSKR